MVYFGLGKVCDDCQAEMAIFKYPMASADELKQVLFAGHFPGNPPGVYFDLHNLFKDKVIAGLVVTISYVNTNSKRPIKYDLVIRESCGPLESIEDSKFCFGSRSDAARKGAVVSLKEMYFVPGQAPAK